MGALASKRPKFNKEVQITVLGVKSYTEICKILLRLSTGHVTVCEYHMQQLNSKTFEFSHSFVFVTEC